ncbi:hypothetical protein [Cupriavidus sp. CP313]
MPDIRLNFTISLEEHPELAYLEAGAGRRGGRSTEVIRLLKLGAKADMALRAIEGDRLIQVAKDGLLAEGSPLRHRNDGSVLGRQTAAPAASAPPAQAAASRHAPAGAAYPVEEQRQLPTAAALPTPVDPPVSRGGFAANAELTQPGPPRRSGKSKASAFMG